MQLAGLSSSAITPITIPLFPSPHHCKAHTLDGSHFPVIGHCHYQLSVECSFHCCCLVHRIDENASSATTATALNELPGRAAAATTTTESGEWIQQLALTCSSKFTFPASLKLCCTPLHSFPFTLSPLSPSLLNRLPLRQLLQRRQSFPVVCLTLCHQLQWQQSRSTGLGAA